MTNQVESLANEARQCVKLIPGTITLGRARSNDMSYEDLSISKFHAKIFTYLNVSYIEDLGSKNGTYLNGKKVAKHVVKEGDSIKIGRVEIAVIK